MNKKQFRTETAFQATLAIARRMVAQGLVTQREYRAFVKRLLENVCDTVKVPTVIVQNSPSHRGNFPIKSGTP